jgi:hypothetical protein
VLYGIDRQPHLFELLKVSFGGCKLHGL